MTLVRLQQHIAADTAKVWNALADIASHVEWMHDAVAIRFTSERTEGTGTEFECDTKIGPLRTTDKLLITQWIPMTEMRVRHVGVVTGEGSFRLESVDQTTVVTWEEQLNFPLYMGGRIGETFAKSIFERIWRGNLKRLAARIES